MLMLNFKTQIDLKHKIKNFETSGTTKCIIRHNTVHVRMNVPYGKQQAEENPKTSLHNK